VALLLGGVGQVKAESFTVSGTFEDGATLSGTVTIDVMTGVATAVDLVVGPPDSLTFTFIQSQLADQASGTYTLFTGTAASGLPNLNIVLPTTTLVNYSGGFIASTTQPFGGFFSDIFYSDTLQVNLTQGTLTAPTPEPASLTLLAIGAAGLAGFGWRKRRRAA
jgi:hypothetical protein